MIQKAYKYRLYPTNEQKILLEKNFNATRWVYNWGLRKKINQYKKYKNHSNKRKRVLSNYDLQKQLPYIKKIEKLQWLNEAGSLSLIFALRNLDSAYRNFFRRIKKSDKQKGFPKFKSKYASTQSFQFHQGHKIDFDKKLFSAPKIFNIPIIIDRKFKGKMKTATISKKSTGKYYVSILVEEKGTLPKKPVMQEKTTLGIDVGLKHFAVLSNGVKIENPKCLEKSKLRLEILQRRLSRKKKRSSNYKKAKLKVALLHEKIFFQRQDFIHKLTHSLTNDKKINTLKVENLNIKGMVKNHCLAKAISDAAWSEFKNKLQYKSEWYGRNLIEIDTFYPSSKLCGNCGKVNKDLKLKHRKWKCKVCGIILDRDLNAAQNLKNF